MRELNADIDYALNNYFIDRYPADAVRKIEQLTPEEAAEILKTKTLGTALKVWRRFSPYFAARLLKELEPDYRAKLLGQIEPNFGAIFLKAMDETLRLEILDQLQERFVKNDLIRAMSYQEESAGALMDARAMYFRPDMKVGEVVSLLRGRPHGMYHKLYTVDHENQLHGIIDMEDVALAEHESTLATLERLNPVCVDADASREELVKIFESQKVTDLPVVDVNRRFIGILRYHVLVDAALEESSVDMQTMVGVSKDERALSSAPFAMRKRQPWLQINLVTAFMAAAVVGIFEDTIAHYTALAVLLPVVAGQSGNTGAQSLAVTMRGLALREIYPRMWPRIVLKEFFAGLMNGVAIAITTGLGVYIWSKSIGLTMIIMISMVLSMAIASVSGAAIPMMLTVAGQDPAQSSSIFLTTVTDIAGFFSFLGIATMFMRLL